MHLVGVKNNTYSGWWALSGSKSPSKEAKKHTHKTPQDSTRLRPGTGCCQGPSFGGNGTYEGGMPSWQIEDASLAH